MKSLSWHMSTKSLGLNDPPVEQLGQSLAATIDLTYFWFECEAESDRRSVVRQAVQDISEKLYES